MKFEDFGKEPMKPPKRKSDIHNCILYGFFFIVCFFDIKRFYPFAIIFALLVGYFIWHHIKHKDDPIKPHEMAKEFLKSEKEQEKDIKIKQKEAYDEFASAIDEEFDNSEIDELIRQEDEKENGL